MAWTDPPPPWSREAATSFRAAVRSGFTTGVTSQPAFGATQANVVILPAEAAPEFQTFCMRNSKACPLLDRTEAGDPRPPHAAPGADLRTDVPRYRVYRHGHLVGEPTSITDLWRDDLVGFLLGCSFTFEMALVAAGIPIRHHETGTNVPMYRTQLPCASSGRFEGNLIVSMRPVHQDRLALVSEICSAFPRAHGAPRAVGYDTDLGIADLDRPDFGERVDIREDEVPAFWACGVTAEVAASAAGLDLLVTHAPGHMFVTDWPSEVGAVAALSDVATTAEACVS